MQKLFYTLFLLPVFLFGQESAVQQPVKVGLVLSGGGAKGLAHIGALKVIEESGVEIDYIGGTSMGAIIGALYASGYSANQLDSIFREIDFQELIQDDVPREAKTFYEKEDAERYALTLPFNNFQLSFPSAISGGQNIYNLLVKLLYHVKDTRDFNQLPIPFFCVATNIETGEEVLLDEGYLPEAILASGTFPSLFEPTEINGSVLIDGGVVNNYPINEVRAMGATKIIGVDVQHGLYNRDELLSATDVILQINNYRSVRDMKAKAQQTEVYIKPNVAAFSVIDFNQGKTIIVNGEQAAKEKMYALQALAAEQQKRKKQIPMPAKAPDSLRIQSLQITGNTNYSRGYVKGKLQLALDESIPFEKLRNGVNNLAATENFQAIRYELFDDLNTGTNLVLKLREKPNKTFLRLAAHYDNLYQSAALINLTKKNLFMNDDVGSFDVILGDNLRYNLQYYIDKGSYWSFGFNSKFNEFSKAIDYGIIESNFDVSTNGNLNTITVDIKDVTNQMYIQTVLGQKFLFNLGVEHKYYRLSTKTIGNTAVATTVEDGVLFEDSNFYSSYAVLKYDTYDDPFFPSRGFYFDGDMHFYMFSSDFNNNFKQFAIGKSRMGGAFSLGNKLALNIETEGGFKLGATTLGSFDFVLGGYGAQNINNFSSFIGYDFLSIPGNSYAKAYARFDFEFQPKNHLLFAANVANVADDLFRTGDWFTAPNYSGYGLGYALETVLGPVQALYGWNPEQSKGELYFSIGYSF